MRRSSSAPNANDDQPRPGDVLTDPWGDYLVRYPIIFSTRWFVIDSGFFEHEDPEIHRLSLLLIRVVTASFGVALGFLWGLVAGWYIFVARSSKNFTPPVLLVRNAVGMSVLHLILFRASVQAVRTRNKLCCCGLVTYMGAFQVAYLILALEGAAALTYHLFVHPCADFWNPQQYLVTLGLLLVLAGASLAAEYARRLRRVLPPTPDRMKPAAATGSSSSAFDNATVIVEDERVSRASFEQDHKLEEGSSLGDCGDAPPLPERKLSAANGRTQPKPVAAGDTTVTSSSSSSSSSKTKENSAPTTMMMMMMHKLMPAPASPPPPPPPPK